MSECAFPVEKIVASGKTSYEAFSEFGKIMYLIAMKYDKHSIVWRTPPKMSIEKHHDTGDELHIIVARVILIDHDYDYFFNKGDKYIGS